MNIVITFLCTLSFSSAFFLGKTSTLRHKYHYTNYRLQSSKLSSGDAITIPLNEDPDSNTKIGAWIPIASAHSLAGLGPQKIRVMGIDLVVWNSGHESHYDEKTSKDTSWSVMADVCPHRLAPLSQGRVDPETGCIECPYHGWQFDTDGKLQRIPQADESEIAPKKLKHAAVATHFATHLAGDLIFAFLPSSIHGEMFLQSMKPEDMFYTLRREMEQNSIYFVRELPYSADFLIENFMDPAHIPFAHHGLQSFRSDASSIPMNTFVSNFTHIEVSFEDFSRKKKRKGIVSFQRPTMYHYRTQINDSEEYRTALNIHVVPVEAGKSRILYTFQISNWLPIWIQHAASNRFLNTDSWIHDAEYNTRKRSSTSSPYILPTQSDFGVKAFRQWWVQHGFSTAPKNTFGPADFTSLRLMDRREQIDPWKNHSRQCASCRRALKVIQRIQAGGLISSFASSILLRYRPFLFLFTLSLSLGSYFICKQLATVIEGSPFQSGYADRSPSHT